MFIRRTDSSNEISFYIASSPLLGPLLANGKEKGTREK